jgi:hypothetical protein
MTSAVGTEMKVAPFDIGGEGKDGRDGAQALSSEALNRILCK